MPEIFFLKKEPKKGQEKRKKDKTKKRAALKRASKHNGGTPEQRGERMAVPFPHFCLALHSKAGLNTPLSWLPHRAKDGTESAKGALRCDAARFEVELIGKEETTTEMEHERYERELRTRQDDGKQMTSIVPFY